MPDKDHWNIDDYQSHLQSLPQAGHALLQLLSPQLGEKILDIGCGDGRLADKIAAMGCTVVAIDNSSGMVDAAKRIGVDARLMDARIMSFEREFDAVFSHAALHWIDDQEKVIERIAAALKPGGRFLADCGTHGNITAIVTGLINAITRAGYADQLELPWFYFEEDEYRMMLEKHGFGIDVMRTIARFGILPNGMREWLRVFTMPLLSHVPSHLHESIFEDAEQFMRPFLYSDGGVWRADYVRLVVHATKK